MRKTTLLTAAALLLLPLSASAGGIGAFASGGVHEGRAPYYRDDGLQGIDIQYRPNNAIGFEGLLGDKDDKKAGQKVGISIGILLVMVLAVILSIMASGWKMSRTLGGIMFGLYLLYVGQEILRAALNKQFGC